MDWTSSSAARNSADAASASRVPIRRAADGVDVGTAAGAAGSPGTFRDQLLELVANQPRRMFPSVVGAVGTIAAVASQSAPLGWVLGWVAVCLAIVVARIIVQSPNRLRHLTPRQRLNGTRLLVGISGVAHGSALAFAPGMGPFELAILSMIMIGLACGSVATAAGYRPIFLAYIVPTMVPLSIVWILAPVMLSIGWVYALTSVLVGLYTYMLTALANDTYRTLKRSYVIRLRGRRLNQKLQTAIGVAEEANAERDAVISQLNGALSAAESASRAKTRFLASASHDLRQPMQTLSMFAAALGLRPLDERSRQITVQMNDALGELTSELDALLDLSKLDAGTVQPSLAAHQARPILERIVEIFAAAAEQKGLRLALAVPGDAWIRTDRKLFERLVRNLVENALKYTSRGGVTLSAQLEGEFCRIEVRDTGCGIPADQHERVFEEFYQLGNPERDRRRGLGLGLSIVRRLAVLLGIAIQVESAPGAGSRFVLQVPRAQPLAASRDPVEDDDGFDAPLLQVLLVDDEVGVRNSMKTLLQELGSTVEAVAGATEALEATRDRRPDIVIADFRLRGEDSGLKVIGALRERWPDLPALLVTGETAPERLRAAQSSGIPLLHKPVTPAALLKEIGRLTAAEDVGQPTGRES